MSENGREQIVNARKAGDAETVGRLLDASPELLTPALWPPAIFQGQSLEVTRLLLDRGLNPNECSAPGKPLHLAASRGKLEIMRLLLERGARRSADGTKRLAGSASDDGRTLQVAFTRRVGPQSLALSSS